MELADADRAFLLHEIDHVRKSYDSFVEETRKLERYAVVVVAATWSWCAANTANQAFGLLIWFPFIACTLFGIRAATIHIQSRATRSYIVKVERALGVGAGLGWATAQQAHSKGLSAGIAVTAYVFWFILSVVTIAVPLVHGARMTASG